MSLTRKHIDELYMYAYVRGQGDVLHVFSGFIYILIHTQRPREISFSFVRAAVIFGVVCIRRGRRRIWSKSGRNVLTQKCVFCAPSAYLCMRRRT